MLNSILTFLVGETRLKRWATRAMAWGLQRSVSALENPEVRDMLCREGMARQLQEQTRMNTWTQEDLERYRCEMNTPEAAELEARLTAYYSGSRVERVVVQELPDGSSCVSVCTDRGALSFQAPVLQVSDSSQEVPFAS